MANDQESRGGGPEDLGQDPYVERRRPDPSQPPEAVRILEGLLGDSDREGYKRLYFNRELDHYAEFRTEDVVFSEPIPPDQPPFLGQQATRVGIRRDATIEYTRLRTPRPVDEFDLDIRLAPFERMRSAAAGTQGGLTCGFGCTDWTCNPAGCGGVTSPPCDPGPFTHTMRGCDGGCPTTDRRCTCTICPTNHPDFC
jgi:hypothetical protein